MSCANGCGRTFNRAYNKERHEREACPYAEQAEGVEEEVEEENDVQIEVDEQAPLLKRRKKDIFDDSETEDEDDDDEEEDEEDEDEDEDEDDDEDDDPWKVLKENINDKYRKLAEKKRDHYVNEGVEEKNAEDKAVNVFIPDMRKALQQEYRHFILFMPKMQRDPFHQSFMKTVKKLQKGFSMTLEEAVDNALNMKGHHFAKVYPYREEQEETEDDEDEAQEQRHYCL